MCGIFPCSACTGMDLQSFFMNEVPSLPEPLESVEDSKSTSSEGVNERETIFVLRSPSGEFVTTEKLISFCHEHALIPSMMYKVSVGKQRHHHGWCCWKVPKAEVDLFIRTKKQNQALSPTVQAAQRAVSAGLCGNPPSSTSSYLSALSTTTGSSRMKPVTSAFPTSQAQDNTCHQWHTHMPATPSSTAMHRSSNNSIPSIATSRSTQSREFFIVRKPTGELFGVRSLNKFCKDHDLPVEMLLQCADELRSDFMGYRCWRPRCPLPYDAMGRALPTPNSSSEESRIVSEQSSQDELTDKKRKRNFEPDFKLPMGWKIVVKMRKSGKSAGTRYSVYISPDGKVFRSRHDVLQYHKNYIEGTDFDIEGQVRAIHQRQGNQVGMFGIPTSMFGSSSSAIAPLNQAF